jgi:hypothetical protein
MTARVVQYRHVDASRKIPLPSGVDGQTLRLSELRKELDHLISIDPTWGKSRILDEWEAKCLERAEASAKATGQEWRGPNEGTMKRAAAEIGGVA